MNIGHVVFSPRNTNASAECTTFFGFILDGSTPPPQGSGRISVFDYSQNEYKATYNVSDFTVTIDGCSYIFALEVNTVSGDGLYKLRWLSSSGTACPQGSSCYANYWLATNAMGVFSFLDFSEDPSCPAFFAIANPGSTEAGGTFTIAGVAVGNATSWVPPGYSGKYDGYQGVVWISTPGCSSVFILDSTITSIAFPSGAPPPMAGAAVLDFYGVIPQTSACPTACMQDGYNVVWDATGDSPRPRT